MKRGLEFLFDNVEYPVNISFPRKLNKITMESLLYDCVKIRMGIVTIGGTSWVLEIPQEDIVAKNWIHSV